MGTTNNSGRAVCSLVSVVALTALTASSSGQAIIRVDDVAFSGGDGSSWQNPVNNLQTALAMAQPGDEIWVAQGVYTPSDTDASVSFALKPGVAMYGGFAGEEPTRAARDPELYPTVLSGDIGRDDTINPINFNTPNAGHVVVASGVDASSVLDGFIIEHGAYGPAGTPAGHELMYGSGLYCVGGSPTINDCTFDTNYAAFASGGAIYLSDSSPTITSCRFVNNYVHLGNGGAVMIYGDLAPTISDCVFTNNTCVFSSPDASGGAVYNQSTAPLTVSRCRFESNVVRPFYSIGDDEGYGGAISSFSGGLSVYDSVFVGNRATFGGGVMSWSDATIVNCLFDSNTAEAREGSFFEIGGIGGGVATLSFADRVTEIINCTFVGNHGKEESGVSANGANVARIRSCVFWDNTAWNPEFAAYYRAQLGGNFDIAYSLVPGIFGPPAAGEDPIDPENLAGMIDADPLLVGAGDHHLQPGSPAIDAGDNTSWTLAFTHDLDALPRFVDDPGSADTGLGSAPVVDMGAYEFQAAPTGCSEADLAEPLGTLDFSDVVAFLSAFGAMDPAADLAPPLGVFDFSDVVSFLAAFGAGCP